MANNISKRLQIIGDLVLPNSSVYDVGADHGQLEQYIASKVNKVVAVENKKGPFEILQKSTKNILNCETLLCNGLEKLCIDNDVIVVAGMGGSLIVDILSQSKDKLQNIKQIIVDAHRDIPLVRTEVSKLGFYINKEVIVKEKDRYYFVISFLKGHKVYSDEEIEFGVRITNDPLFNEYREYEINRLMGIYSKSKDDEIIHRIERIKSL